MDNWFGKFNSGLFAYSCARVYLFVKGEKDFIFSVLHILSFLIKSNLIIYKQQKKSINTEFLIRINTYAKM